MANSMLYICCYLVAKSCPTLCDHLLGSSIRWDFPGNKTVVNCHFLLQGIFLTQGLNQHLLSWQVNSLPLSHQRSSKYVCVYVCVCVCVCVCKQTYLCNNLIYLSNNLIIFNTIKKFPQRKQKANVQLPQPLPEEINATVIYRTVSNLAPMLDTNYNICK